MTASDLEIPSFIEQTPLFNQQWYLQNRGQTEGTSGADANIVDAWSRATGKGVVIGFVDQGVAYTHPDLNDNYNSVFSYDFQDDDRDPFPLVSENHGTQVAGIAVAEGNNQGIIGAAPEATFASLRINFTNALEDYVALSYLNQDIDIYNNSWNLSDNFVEIPQLAQDTLKNGIEQGRGGLGNIYVFAAGNNALEADNVNYDSFTNSRYTITVAAIDHEGKHSSYSNPGASLLIAGYSSNDNVGMITTDNSDELNLDGYTEDFGGTSAATPLVSGVIALMLEANPNLTWRDVQHILVATAEKNDPNEPNWVQNGAGYHVNDLYGFGSIDAIAAVNQATIWQNVAEEISVTSETITVNTLIPDRDATGISSSIKIEEDINLEWVEIVFDAEHLVQGDLEVVLTSPDGTQSVLAKSRNENQTDYNNWKFTSVRHWGESSQGEWTLTVADQINLNSGTWNSWQINFYGTTGESNNTDDNPPTVINPIADLTITENDDSQIIDLSNVFQDVDRDRLAIAIESNTNDNLVSATIEQELLTLNLAENQTGIAEITLRATANGKFVDNTFTVSVEEPKQLAQTIDLFRFRNTTFATGTYIFVGKEEKDLILQDENLSNTFSLDGVEDNLINPAFVASTTSGEDLSPFYRIKNLELSGTYLFVSTQEYNAIFAPNSPQQNRWEKEGLNAQGEDIPEFYLYGGSADRGTEFNRFQNQENGTFLYAGTEESNAIKNNPNLANIFSDQGIAFKSLN